MSLVIEVVDDLRGVLAFEEQLAHVRGVEEAGRGAHGPVLLGDARVLDGHLPAGEGDELAPGVLVLFVQRGAQKRLGHRHARVSIVDCRWSR